MKRTNILLTAVVLLVLLWAVPVSAASSSSSNTKKVTDISSGVTHSYSADSTVQTGMIVQLKANDTTTVIPLAAKEIKNMLGVVIPPANATIVLSPQDVTKQQVLVGTTGNFNVLVSNQNGRIKAGDYITVSSVDGVGMRADSEQAIVLGRAGADFNGTTNVIGTVQLKDSLGHDVSVALSRIPVEVNISRSPLFTKSVDFVPSFLAKVAVTVANKPVSAARIYLSLVLLIITLLLAGNLLYSGVRNGMIAVGRNPLSKKSIIKSLIQTVIAGLIVFVVGVFAVYLLLKL